MAAIDKMNEFYTCIDRFSILATCYRPENLPEEINQSLNKIIEFSRTNKDFRDKIEEAHEWFEEANERLETMRRKELLAYLVKECSL